MGHGFAPAQGRTAAACIEALPLSPAAAVIESAGFARLDGSTSPALLLEGSHLAIEWAAGSLVSIRFQTVIRPDYRARRPFEAVGRVRALDSSGPNVFTGSVKLLDSAGSGNASSVDGEVALGTRYQLISLGLFEFSYDTRGALLLCDVVASPGENADGIRLAGAWLRYAR